MENNQIKKGDRVYVNSGIHPRLYFMVEEIRTTHGQTMICGSYGCFALSVIKKEG